MTPVQGVQVPWVWQKCPYSENEFIYLFSSSLSQSWNILNEKHYWNLWYVVQRLIWIPQVNTRLTGSRRKKPQPHIFVFIIRITFVYGEFITTYFTIMTTDISWNTSRHIHIYMYKYQFNRFFLWTNYEYIC